MKISRTDLNRIIKEELAEHVKRLLEAPIEVGTDEEEDTSPADDVPSPENAPEGPPTEIPEDEPEELDTGDEEADDDLEKDVGGDPDQPVPGAIADELQGKTIKAIRSDPKSEMMPGSQEISIEFQDSPDTLRILITQTGQVKYFYRGLHNDLGDAQGFEADGEELPDMGDGQPGDPDELSLGDMIPGADGEEPPPPEMDGPPEEETEELPLGDEEDSNEPTSSRR